jgi:hypothetical protein
MFPTGTRLATPALAEVHGSLMASACGMRNACKPISTAPSVPTPSAH